MPLTEIQIPEKQHFYNVIQGAATELDLLMERFLRLSEFLAKLNADDLLKIGVPNDTELRADLILFRTAINEIVSIYNGNLLTPSNTFATIMDKFRRMV